MKTIMIALGVLALIPFSTRAQTDEDALRYAQQTFGGSARYMGLSGAFGALGADIGSLSSNPAGLGLYRHSDASFTGAVTNTVAEPTFLGNTTSNGVSPFNVPSWGLVFSSDLTRRHPDNRWKRLNFAFGGNRLNDYNRMVYFSGFNTQNSLSDYYVEEANQNGGVAPSNINNRYPFGSGLFYQTYVIDPSISDSNLYETRIFNGNIQQTIRLDNEGSNNEFVLSIGSNYDDHLLLGATIGFPSLHYHSNSTVTETDVNDAYDNFDQFTYYNYVSTHGYGINGKFGMTYIFGDYLRAGFAVHTPTLYSMHDDYNSTMSSSIDQGGSYDWQSPFGVYDYELVTPYRLVWSAAGFLKDVGFVTVDYELVDYHSMHYNFNRTSSPDEFNIESQLNQTIKAKYKMASNVRGGIELAFDMFRIRGGVAYYGSPFQSGFVNDESDFSRWSYSGGFGVRGDHIYFDAGYVRTNSNEYYQPYTLSDESVPGATIKRGVNNFVATIGFRMK